MSSVKGGGVVFPPGGPVGAKGLHSLLAAKQKIRNMHSHLADREKHQIYPAGALDSKIRVAEVCQLRPSAALLLISQGRPESRGSPSGAMLWALSFLQSLADLEDIQGRYCPVTGSSYL